MSASAASPSLYFSPSAKDVRVGDSIDVKVLIDSDQPLNAYAVAFAYSSDLLELVGFDNSRSIMDVWQKQPAVNKGVVTLNGGSIKPFFGTDGELLTLRLSVIKEGVARLAFNESAAYLANGKGTKVIPVKRDIALAISKAPVSDNDAIKPMPAPSEIDDTPPAISFLSLIDNPFNEGQKLLAFQISDTGSGIMTTTVRFFSLLSWSEWSSAQNPTAIPRSAWIVKFRASDSSGNIIERTMYNWQGLLSLPFFAIVGIVIGLLLYAIYMVIRKKLKNKHIHI
ncbi:MAG: cohesin domain-containing protein [Patescibacteria group bacterium]